VKPTACTKPLALIYERCSSAKQIDGTSEDRQSEVNLSCAEYFGFEVSDILFDAGVSGFHGDNFEAGLARIFERIQPGQGLIFEDMRRFGRQNWKIAVDYLEKFLLKGVKVMTSQNRQMITLEAFRSDPGTFLPVILAAHQAHDENAQKAYYVRESWVSKRAEIEAGTAIRQRLPSWLYHEKTFVGSKVVLGAVKVDEAKAQTIREIFRLVLAGQSLRTIAKDFNLRGVPVVSIHTKGWKRKGEPEKERKKVQWNGRSVLATIIRNPAVIGDYVTAENKTIKGIFPAIVDEKTFHAANARATGNRTSLATSHTALGNNLFTGLVKCPTCGGNMSLRVHHKGKKHGGKVYRYLWCSQTKNGQNQIDCKIRPKYDLFEQSIFLLFKDGNNEIKTLLGQASAPSEFMVLQGKLDIADRKLNEMVKFQEEAPSKRMAERIQQLEQETETLRAEAQTKEAQEKAATPPLLAYSKFVAELSEHLQEPEYRERVKVALRDIIKFVQFEDSARFTVHFNNGATMPYWMGDTVLLPKALTETPDRVERKSVISGAIVKNEIICPL
jgi:DNA invertase Pin-like site-specific DNA recombinase